MEETKVIVDIRQVAKVIRDPEMMCLQATDLFIKLILNIIDSKLHKSAKKVNMNFY